MKKFSIRAFVPPILKAQAGSKLTAREIAHLILKLHPDSCTDKMARSKANKTPLTSESDLLQQIVAEIGAQRTALEQKDDIKTTETRPRKYFYSTSSDEDDANDLALIQNSEDIIQTKICEADLYPLLSKFLLSELAIYSMRVDERKSSNRNGYRGNHWLYPDMIGIEDLSRGWHREIRDCAAAYMDKKSKLYSFEVKLLINRSNVRESFFQAVSNSSWANYGYLVARDINGTDTLAELRVLSGAHGIGVIRLNDDVSQSDIIIPSRERTEIDWQTADRLTHENTDFRTFIMRVRQFYQTGDIRPNDWDASSVE